MPYGYLHFIAAFMLAQAHTECAQGVSNLHPLEHAEIVCACPDTKARADAAYARHMEVLGSITAEDLSSMIDTINAEDTTDLFEVELFAQALACQIEVIA